jgi:hypothetical protein
VEGRVSEKDSIAGKRKRVIEMEEDEHVSVLFPNKRGNGRNWLEAKRPPSERQCFGLRRE